MSVKSAIKFLVLFILCASALADFEDHFKDCRPNVSGFDACMREALNSIRPYFKTGVPKYNIDPFDPFFAREISVIRGLGNLGFTLTLRNVTETGWSASKVTKFVSDLSNYKIVYTQSFPEKALHGDYEFVANVLGTTMTNKGKFTLTLYNLMQTSTITRPPYQKLTAEIDVQSIGNLKLHITNLLRGRSFLEGVLDRIINSTWKQGFPITRGIINELVSKAFTEIFGKSFQNFNFEKLIKTKSEDRYGTFAT